MVTVAGAYGNHSTSVPYRPPEPPSVTEVRSAFDSVLNQVLRKFVNESAHATATGIKALDAGDYVTLDDLEKLISKG